MMYILEYDKVKNLENYHSQHKNPRYFKFFPEEQYMLLDLAAYIRTTEITYQGEKNDSTQPQLCQKTESTQPPKANSEHEKQTLERCIQGMLKRNANTQPVLFTKDFVNSFENGLSIDILVVKLKNEESPTSQI